MPHPSLAKILRLHFSETDKYGGRPLYEAIIQKCKDLNIAGATVFQGLEGFGEMAEIHKRHIAGHGEPIVVVVADSAENIERLLPIIEDMMHTGTIAVSEAEVIRVQKGGKTANV